MLAYLDSNHAQDLTFVLLNILGTMFVQYRRLNWCVIVIYQERAAGALANLAADDKCSMVVAAVGGVHALVKLACSCEYEGVQEQVELPSNC